MDNSAVYSLVHFPEDVNEIKHETPKNPINNTTLF